METTIRELEKQIVSLELEQKESEVSRKALQEALRSAHGEIDALRERSGSLEQDLEDLQASLSKVTSEKHNLEVSVEALKRRLDDAQDSREDSRIALEKMNNQLIHAREELVRAGLELQNLEETLRDCQRKNVVMNDEVTELRTEAARYQKRPNSPVSLSQGKLSESDIAVLETALLEANREIGRLTALLRQDSICNAQKGQLEQSVEAHKICDDSSTYQTRAIRNVSAVHTPVHMNGDFSSVRLANLSLKQPRTPGKPLNDVSIFFTRPFTTI